MATEKNITMKQFNGTDYDTLYPKTIASQIPDVYSKTDIITTGTLSQFGLSADKLPNDAFQQIKTLIDNVQASADGKAKIQTGSYVGTGTYGADNPCSLTFDFEPKVVFIQSSVRVLDSSVENGLLCTIPIYRITYTNYLSYAYYLGYSTDSFKYGYYNTSNKTLYWYVGGNNYASTQMNYKDVNYQWVAIG